MIFFFFFNFQPECKVSDDMRFTAYNQYVHRMLHRWGPNVKEMMAIKKYLATQSITLTQPPWVKLFVYNLCACMCACARARVCVCVCVCIYIC